MAASVKKVLNDIADHALGIRNVYSVGRSCYGSVAQYLKKTSGMWQPDWKIVLYGYNDDVTHAVLIDSKNYLVNTYPKGWADAQGFHAPMTYPNGKTEVHLHGLLKSIPVSSLEPTWSSKMSSQSKQLPAIRVKSYANRDGRSAQVELDIVHTSESRDNHELVANALTKLFGGKVHCVKDSFVSLNSSGLRESITGVLRSNIESIVVGDSLPKNFHSLSSNLYMDAEESVWSLKQSASGKLLVKSTGMEKDGALGKLIEDVCSGQLSLSSDFKRRTAERETSISSAEGGDMVQYIDDNGQTKFGLVVASGESHLLVQPREGEAENVSLSSVVEVFDTEGMPLPELTKDEEMQISISAARGVNPAEKLVEYYRKVYAHAPEYFAKIEQRIREYRFM